MSFAKYQYKTGLSPFETRSQELNPVFPRACHSPNHLKHCSLLPRVCVNRKLESRMELWLKFSTTVWNVGILNDALTPYWKWANAQIGNAWPIIFQDTTWRTKVISYIRTMEKKTRNMTENGKCLLCRYEGCHFSWHPGIKAYHFQFFCSASIYS